MENFTERKTPAGLYSPRFEHDNCGIGAVVDIKGRKSHKTIDDALQIVEHLEHRAGKDAEGKTGDGVGILTQISDKFFQKAAAEQGLTRVGSVTLELGEVSGAIPQELVSCWDWAVNRTELLRGAPLKIETLPAVTHCEGCGEDYPTVQHGRTCPYCGSEKTWLLRGNEISIKEIEAI